MSLYLTNTIDFCELGIDHRNWSWFEEDAFWIDVIIMPLDQSSVKAQWSNASLELDLERCHHWQMSREKTQCIVCIWWIINGSFLLLLVCMQCSWWVGDVLKCCHNNITCISKYFQTMFLRTVSHVVNFQSYCS